MAHPPPFALDDLTVIELPCYDSMPFFAASMAARAFAAMGANVIKIEAPQIGAAERHWGPFRGAVRDLETGGLHLYLNANKKSVTLDLENARERAALMRLLEHADILFNPNLPNFNERLGLDWSALIKLFPQLVVVSTTFFGTQSPYRNHRGGDLIASQMSVVGYGTPMQQVTDPFNQPPLRLGGRQADYVTGYTAAVAALCALRGHRSSHRSIGMHVDVSQWLAMVQMCRPELSVYTHEAEDAPYRKRLLIRSKTSIQYMFPCKDGWVSCGIASNHHWRALKSMMGNPEWAESEMFATFNSRLSHSDVLEAVLIEWLSTRTRAEVFELAQASHVPAFPVNSPAEVAANPQYAAREYFIDSEHSAAGKVRMPGAPIIFSRTPWRLHAPAPLLGQHNPSILSERLGLGEAELKEVTGRTATLLSEAARRQGRSRPPASGKSREGASTKLPFAGIRVADFGWIYALPYATAWLGALGADVIRIETSLRPDLVRYLSGTDGKPGINRSGIFNGINFSKRSISLNLAHPDGQEIARRLVSVSDIATENFTSATMRKFGLDYEHLRQVKPDLIMLSGTSLGQTGPLSNTVGWGPTNQAFAGTSHLTGYKGGEPSAGGGTWPDFAVGIAMLFAMVAALHYRERTGEGQYIDVSMCEVVTSMLPEAMLEFFMNGRELTAIGNRDPEMAPHGVFRTRGHDQWLALAVPTDAEFEKLCTALEIPWLAKDRRFLTTEQRLLNVDALEREIEAATVLFERDALVARLRELNLAAGPAYGAFDLMSDPAFLDSGMMVPLCHKECGERLTPGLPVRFSHFTPDYRPAPLFGEHTAEVLTELLGYSSAEIAELRANKVLV
jgi:crotonobetainyl-CoA:carnitine CoA-transferase CaiB-like acyl-CoA transferase